jgi:hypothetical protein
MRHRWVSLTLLDSCIVMVVRDVVGALSLTPVFLIGCVSAAQAWFVCYSPMLATQERDEGGLPLGAGSRFAFCSISLSSSISFVLGKKRCAAETSGRSGGPPLIRCALASSDAARWAQSVVLGLLRPGACGPARRRHACLLLPVAPAVILCAFLTKSSSKNQKTNHAATTADGFFMMIRLGGRAIDRHQLILQRSESCLPSSILRTQTRSATFDSGVARRRRSLLGAVVLALFGATLRRHVRGEGSAIKLDCGPDCMPSSTRYRYCSSLPSPRSPPDSGGRPAHAVPSCGWGKNQAHGATHCRRHLMLFAYKKSRAARAGRGRGVGTSSCRAPKNVARHRPHQHKTFGTHLGHR